MILIFMQLQLFPVCLFLSFLSLRELPAQSFYVGDSGSAADVYTLTSGGSSSLAYDLPAGAGPWGMDLTTDGSALYVAEPGSGSIAKIDTATGTVNAAWVTGLPTGIRGLAVDDSGNVYVSDISAGAIIKIAPDATVNASFITTVPSAFYVDLDGTGNLLIGRASSAAQQIYVYRASDAAPVKTITMSAGGVAGSVSGLVAGKGPDAGYVFAITSTGNTLSKVSLLNESTTVITSGLSGTGLAYSNGDIYNANLTTGNLSRIEQNGTVTVIGQVPGTPRDLVVIPGSTALPEVSATLGAGLAFLGLSLRRRRVPPPGRA